MHHSTLHRSLTHDSRYRVLIRAGSQREKCFCGSSMTKWRKVRKCGEKKGRQDGRQDGRIGVLTEQKIEVLSELDSSSIDLRNS